MRNIIDGSVAGPCLIKNCKNTSQFNVRIALRVHAEHEPAMSTPAIQVCAEHNDVKWEDVCTDEGWEQICKGIESIKRQRPKKEFSFLVIEPIQE